MRRGKVSGNCCQESFLAAHVSRVFPRHQGKKSKGSRAVFSYNSLQKTSKADIYHIVSSPPHLILLSVSTMNHLPPPPQTSPVSAEEIIISVIQAQGLCSSLVPLYPSTKLCLVFLPFFILMPHLYRR